MGAMVKGYLLFGVCAVMVCVASRMPVGFLGAAAAITYIAGGVAQKKGWR